MKKLITLIYTLIIILLMVSCNNRSVEESNDFDGKFTLNATIIEIEDNYFLVEPVEGSWELRSSDRITVPMENMEVSPEPEIGDILEIIYNGEIAESYPAQITEVYSIKVLGNK